MKCSLRIYIRSLQELILKTKFIISGFVRLSYFFNGYIKLSQKQKLIQKKIKIGRTKFKKTRDIIDQNQAYDKKCGLNLLK